MRREYPAEFERLWRIHPKGGKIFAFNAMEKLSPDENEIDRWIEKLEDYKVIEQWSKDNGKYAPELSKWINQGFFDGEIINSKPETTEQTVERLYGRSAL